LPTFRRLVYIPTGFVEYMVNYNDGEPQNEEYVSQQIRDGKPFTESLHILHGRNIKYWRSTKITPQQRNYDADIHVSYLIAHPEEEFHYAGISLISHNPGFEDSDGLWVMKVTKGEDRLNRVSHALNCFGRGMGISLDDDLKKIDEKIHLWSGEVTRLDAVFEKMNRLIRTNKFD
jgi:hypothetical protein